MPTITRVTPVPAFVPFNITINSEAEAKALKLLCTTTGYDAVTDRPNLNVSYDDVKATADTIFRGLKSHGVSYLVPKAQRLRRVA